MRNKIYKGAVFFDIDGTLLDEQCGIFTPTDITKKSIQGLKENGYLTCVATGRSKCYMSDVDVNFDAYITCNGAVCEADGEILVCDVFPSDKKLELVEYLDRHGFAFNLETRDICYYGEAKAQKFQWMLELFNINQNCFEPLKNPQNVSANKSMVIFENEEMYQGLLEKFGKYFSIARLRGYPSADINNLNTTKANGIKAITEKLNIPIENTYAFGDGANDRDMLEAAGHGIAMTPHDPILDSVADFVTCSVKDEGIYNALKHFELI